MVKKEENDVQNLRKTLASARVTMVKKEENDVQNLKDPRLCEGDDGKKTSETRRSIQQGVRNK
ncbi:hypothetical protein [Fibrobacter sp.]|uniref:hypothetical protein n=1 Tax=Fibrobacter sp. TaxID=35828 RepID=UPI0025C365C7|nr:hypothetical protein [Fibrobacter sp.]MBR4006405.1 hypothetical protein [Fibrobacter sp.]